MKSNIKKIVAREIIDSRGNPTLEAEVFLESGSKGRAAVPSGASTGSKEALELRDEANKYHGKGVQDAVQNINDILGPLIINIDPNNQEEIDKILISSDGTSDKSKYGANAILAISLAVSHSASIANKISLHDHFYNLYENIVG